MNAIGRFAVAALSARWLAQSALRAGRPAIALDLFGDLDTRRAARAWLPIGDAAALRIDPALLARTLLQLHAAGRIDGWIAGPGTDQLALPAELAAELARVPLLGNAPAAVAAVRDPQRFFALLDTLGLPHPAVAFAPPADPADWLVKDPRGSGGWHIRAASGPAPAPHYFQRRAEGRALSTLFIAAGGGCRLIGCAEQRIESRPDRPYLYAGAIGPIELPAALLAALGAAVERIVAATGLVGLNSLDFLLDGERWQVLEINPRPSATQELYEPSFGCGLLPLHLDACLDGRLPTGRDLPLAGGAQRGTRIVFAPAPLLLDAARLAALQSLPWCADVPAAEGPVPAGAPLCTVTAAVDDAGDDVRRLLEQRVRLVLSLMENPADVRLPA